MHNDQSLQQLRQSVENTLGFPLRTPKDFDALSESIMKNVHMRVSSSTLKRIWGYLTTVSIPRQSTLDILAQYVGHADYNAFCLAQNDMDKSTEVADNKQVVLPPIGSGEGGQLEQTSSFFKRHTWVWYVLLLVITAGAAFLGQYLRKSETTDHSRYILCKGQTFATYQDYLVLFGIHAKDTLWGQRLPHHPSISVWGPQYHHHRWHNDGDSSHLMPTITERWEPDDGSADSMLIAIRNSDHFITYRDLNELRITFMRGLTPDGDSLTFLGVYRMDMRLSNMHHVTWTRVAEEIDLNRLDYLEELRN